MIRFCCLFVIVIFVMSGLSWCCVYLIFFFKVKWILVFFSSESILEIDKWRRCINLPCHMIVFHNTVQSALLDFYYHFCLGMFYRIIYLGCWSISSRWPSWHYCALLVLWTVSDFRLVVILLGLMTLEVTLKYKRG